MAAASNPHDLKVMLQQRGLGDRRPCLSHHVTVRPGAACTPKIGAAGNVSTTGAPG